MRFALILIFLTIALGKDIYWVEYVNAKFVLKKGTVLLNYISSLTHLLH